MILLLCLIALMCTGPAASTTFEMLREACPYSNFCSVKSLKTFNRTKDTMPCCYDCFCDEYCSMFGDCCPDYEPNRTNANTAVLDCKPVHIVTERTKKELVGKYATSNELYRVIDFCPSEYMSDPQIIQKCNGTFPELPYLTDLVLVSDRNGRNFKNKFCAVCHGVYDVISWSLKVEACVEDISSVQLTLSESRFFIINYCVVTSERPRGIHVTSRMLKCPAPVKCGGADPRLIDACFNGPYMPYYQSFGIHKNVFCYEICSRRGEDEICPYYDIVSSRLTLKSHHMLLDLSTDKGPRKQATTGCSEAELMDKYTGKCRRVYCPPFEVISYGACVGLSESFTNLFVHVNVLYTLVDSNLNITINSHLKYNHTMENHFLQNIYRRHGYPKCTIAEIYLRQQYDKTSKQFVRLVLLLIYEISEECTMKYIGDRIRYQTSRLEKENWLIKDRFLQMEGRFSFYEDPPLIIDPTYLSDMLLQVTGNTFKFSSTLRFFLCPYFKLNIEEYLDHVDRYGNISKEYKLQKLSPSSRLIDGFYPLTQNNVAVCVDTFLPKSGQEFIFVHTKLVFISVVIKSFI